MLKKAENSYELLHTADEAGTIRSFFVHTVTKETTVPNKVTTSTPGSGTALTLTTKTTEKAEKNDAPLGNVSTR